jgi:hypothetical protein
MGALILQQHGLTACVMCPCVCYHGVGADSGAASSDEEEARGRKGRRPTTRRTAAAAAAAQAAPQVRCAYQTHCRQAM